MDRRKFLRCGIGLVSCSFSCDANKQEANLPSGKNLGDVDFGWRRKILKPGHVVKWKDGPVGIRVSTVVR